MKTIHLHEKLGQITEHWSPRIIAALNDYHFKLAKIEGDFVWHAHADTDEAFLVLQGEIEIELRDRTLHLGEGDLAVIPAGVEHRPRARQQASILLIEPAGTVNTGDAGADGTTGAWI